MLDPVSIAKLAQLRQQLEQDMPPPWIFTASRWRRFDRRQKPRTNLGMSRLTAKQEVA